MSEKEFLLGSDNGYIQPGGYHYYQKIIPHIKNAQSVLYSDNPDIKRYLPLNNGTRSLANIEYSIQMLPSTETDDETLTSLEPNSKEFDIRDISGAIIRTDKNMAMFERQISNEELDQMLTMMENGQSIEQDIVAEEIVSGIVRRLQRFEGLPKSNEQYSRVKLAKGNGDIDLFIYSELLQPGQVAREIKRFIGSKDYTQDDVEKLRARIIESKTEPKRYEAFPLINVHYVQSIYNPSEVNSIMLQIAQFPENVSETTIQRAYETIDLLFKMFHLNSSNVFRDR